jgi:acetyltransferase-like isoleucine patch superfamily enzyme
MSEEVRNACAEHDVHFYKGATLDHIEPGPIAIEAPASLHRGVYGIDFIGAFSYLGGGNTEMRHISMIGRFCSIAHNIQCGHIEHPTDFISAHPLFQGNAAWRAAKDFAARNQDGVTKSSQLLSDRVLQQFPKIVIGNDVWIGEGAFIRQGVEIGDGAIIAARAVVTKDVPPYAIVAGTPARILRYRFEQAIIAELMEMQWWRYGLSALEGADFTDMDYALWRISDNIASGRAERYEAPILNVTPDTVEVMRYDPETGQLVGR